MKISPIHILIVEDNVAHSELIRRAFENEVEDFRLEMTRSLHETQSYLETATPDVVIIDLNLPDGKGIDLLLNSPEPFTFPVLAMTSFGDEHVAVEAMKAGVLDYIVKSDNAFTDMPHIVQRVLREWEHISKRNQVQAALRISEDRYKRATSASNVGVWELDLATGEMYIAPNLKKLLGYNDEEIPDHQAAWLALIHPDDLSEVEKTLEDYVAGRLPGFEIERRMLHKWDGIRWISTVGTLDRDAQGNPQRMLGTDTDVTETRELVESLKQQDIILKAVNFAAERLLTRPTWQEIIMTVLKKLGQATDADRVAIYQSYPPLDDDMIVVSTCAEWTAHDHVENPLYHNSRMVHRPMHDILKRGEPFCGHTRELSLPTVTMNTALHDVSFAVIPIFVEGGLWGSINFGVSHREREWSSFELEALQTAANMLGAAIERQQAQDVIRESERKFRSLVENAVAGIFMMNEKYEFTYLNAEMGDLLGYDIAELGQVRLLDLLDVESHQKVIEYFSYAQGETTPIRCELIFLRKDGVARQCEMTVTIIKDTSEVYSIGQLLDITDRRQAEQQRLELALEKEKVELMRVFVGNVSHDLKTPLTTIQTGLYLLKRYTDPNQRRERLDLIQQQVHRLDNLIQNLLTISRLDYRPELNLCPLNINDRLYDIEKQFFVQVEQKHLNVKLDLSANIPPINADKDEMDRVFINLMENAINYTPEGQSITIRTYTATNQVGIDIHDSGIGINSEDLPQIFDRFYRSDEARSQLSSGSGLGLAIVKKIIEMHGGSIRVQSQPGEGTTFHVLLPVINQVRTS